MLDIPMSDTAVSPSAGRDSADVYDCHPMIAFAAHNLATRLGARAGDYALVAIRRMRAQGDADGLAIWLALHTHLCQADPAAPDHRLLN